MTTREQLHQMIEELSEHDVDEALRYITWQQDNGFAHMLSRQPQSAASAGDPGQQGAHVIFLDDIKRGPS